MCVGGGGEVSGYVLLDWMSVGGRCCVKEVVFVWVVLVCVVVMIEVRSESLSQGVVNIVCEEGKS